MELAEDRDVQLEWRVNPGLDGLSGKRIEDPHLFHTLAPYHFHDLQALLLMEHVHSFLKRRRGGGDADLHKSISDAVKALSVVQNDGAESRIVFIVTAGKPSKPDKVLEGIEKLKQLRASIVVLGVSPADENELRQYSTGITEVFTGYLDQNLLMNLRNELLVVAGTNAHAFEFCDHHSRAHRQ
ncbi:hypothetical protein ANCDUO_05183 [Ancylostoma duodenale]|uniref:VWFA domain-containing protein n=1 Tax=Ancylostoma duodenale TaxID=51022 RepID=A0A0C2GTA8_9BILA|nr:hypothetical protein ANCDUO_05183 [Ancylostoma duodenale]